MNVRISIFAAIGLALTTGSSTAQHGGAAEAAHSSSETKMAITHPTVLPDAITSFGACRVGGWLYVYGGHIGRAHAHSKDNIIGSFRRLNLTDGQSWNALPSGPALQGTALVAAEDGTMYRVGGTDARNDKGEDADMHSTDSVQRFDPVRMRWQDVTPLPEPRSSHDAIICDNKLYVVGGWNLQGEGDGDWHDTAWVADLSHETLEWKALPPLGHQRRACAVATFAGKVAVLGGISPRGLLNSACVFDPQAGTWSEAPKLPGFAFGTAALGVDGWLYATVMEGSLLKWNGSTDDWQHVAQFETPRFFHRMVPSNENGRILAFGGAGRGGHMRTMEALDLEPREELELREYVIPAPSRVAYRQALLLEDNVLWALGGNRKQKGDRFAPEQFANDIWKIELTTMNASLAGKLPFGCQSMAATSWGSKRKNLVVGGIGVHDGKAQTVTSAYRFDMRRRAALPHDASLPAPRTQAQMVRYGDKVYVIGGVDFTPAPDGGTTKGDTREVLVFDTEANEPKFEQAGIRLPRPRRSFGATVLGDKLYLIGGLGNGFHHAGPCDVYDFQTKQWSELEAPTAWVSPQVATIGSRIYVACGGRMKGQRFREDRSLQQFSPEGGWSEVVAELPFQVRHVQMLAHRNRLLFYSANDSRRDRIVIRTLQPDARVKVLEASMHR